MIHSPGPMPTGNFDNQFSPVVPPPARTFRFPADYYESPASEVRPVFPRWVPLGCGTASAVFLVLLFVVGAFLATTGLGTLIDFALGSALGDIRKMYTPDVTAPQKASFETEVKKMREGLRSNAVPVQDVQPFLKSMQHAISDKKVTPAELGDLTKAAQTAATAPSKLKKLKQRK